MPRVVSMIVLIAILLLIAMLFFQVMAQFVLPLFLAAVLVVIFRPLRDWYFEKCGQRPRIAAGLTTLTIVLIVLTPLTWVVFHAVNDGIELASRFTPEEQDALKTRVATRIDGVREKLPGPLQQSLLPGDEAVEEAILATGETLKPLALGGVQLVLSTTASILFGLAIMVLAVYYFFADGPAMIDTVMRLSPLEDRHELRLLEEFSKISRTVVVATLLSALVQGLLACPAYYFVGLDAVFFLMLLTMLMALVPFLGAAIVWVPCCLWLYAGADRPGAAIALAIYCVVVVSMADNVVKPLVLHGQSKLHPLLALLSVLGGVQALGPIGILVGPMIVVFLQALLVMVQAELKIMDPEKAGEALREGVKDHAQKRTKKKSRGKK